MFPGVYTGEMEMVGRDFSYKESSFYRKLYPSFLFLCSAFAGTGILFVSPLLSLALLSAGPAVEDYRTGYVDDRWSLLILLTGGFTAEFIILFMKDFFLFCWLLSFTGRSFLLFLKVSARGIFFYPPPLLFGWNRRGFSFLSGVPV